MKITSQVNRCGARAVWISDLCSRLFQVIKVMWVFSFKLLQKKMMERYHGWFHYVQLVKMHRLTCTFTFTFFDHHLTIRSRDLRPEFALHLSGQQMHMHFYRVPFFPIIAPMFFVQKFFTRICMVTWGLDMALQVNSWPKIKTWNNGLCLVTRNAIVFLQSSSSIKGQTVGEVATDPVPL